MDVLRKARRSATGAAVARRIEPGRRKRKPRVTPYNPDARDGNSNGRVQDGTVNERPKGTDIVNGKIVPKRSGRKVTTTQTKPKPKKKPTAKQQERISQQQRESAIEDLLTREFEKRVQVIEASLSGKFDSPDEKRAEAESQARAIPSSVKAAITNSDLPTRRLRNRTAQIKKKYKLKNVSVQRILTDDKIDQNDRDAFAKDLLDFFAGSPFISPTKSGGARGFENVAEWLRARSRSFASNNPELIRNGTMDDAIGDALALTAAKVVSDRTRLSQLSGRHHSDFADFFASGSWRDKGKKTLRNSAISATGLPDIDEALEAFSHRALLDSSEKFRKARQGRLRQGRVNRTKAEKDRERDFIYTSIQDLANRSGGARNLSPVEAAYRREQLITNIDEEDAVFAAFTMMGTAKPEHVHKRTSKKPTPEQEALTYGLRSMLMSIMPESVHVEVPAIDKDGKTLFLEDGKTVKTEVRRVQLKQHDLADLSAVQLFTLIASASGYTDTEARQIIPDPVKGEPYGNKAYVKAKSAAADKLRATLMNRGLLDSENAVLEVARRKAEESARRKADRAAFYRDEYNRYARAVTGYRNDRSAAARVLMSEINTADLVIQEATSRISREDDNRDALDGVLKRAVWARAGAERDMLLVERERLVTEIRDNAPHLFNNDIKTINRRRAAAREQAKKMLDEIADLEFERDVRLKRNAEFAEATESEQVVRGARVVTSVKPTGKVAQDRQVTLPSGKTVVIPPFTDTAAMVALKSKITRATRKHNQSISYVDEDGAVFTTDARAMSNLQRLNVVDAEISRLNNEFGHVIGDYTTVPLVMELGADEFKDQLGRDTARLALSELREIPVRVNTLNVEKPSVDLDRSATVRSIITGYYNDQRQRVKTAVSFLPKNEEGDDHRRLARSVIETINLKEHLEGLIGMGLAQSDPQIVAVENKIKDIESGPDGKQLARKLGYDGKSLPRPEDIDTAVIGVRARFMASGAGRQSAVSSSRVRSVVNDEDYARTLSIPQARKELAKIGKERSARLARRKALEKQNFDLAAILNSGMGDKAEIQAKIASNREEISELGRLITYSQPFQLALETRIARYEMRGKLKPEKPKKKNKAQVASEIAANTRSENRTRVAQITQELKRLRTQRRSTESGASTTSTVENIESDIRRLLQERKDLNDALKSDLRKSIRSLF